MTQKSTVFTWFVGGLRPGGVAVDRGGEAINRSRVTDSRQPIEIIYLNISRRVGGYGGTLPNTSSLIILHTFFAFQFSNFAGVPIF
jgi:hypothetical protein